MDNLRKLLEMLEDKLAYTKQLIADYDETMDYVSHSSLLGFAEGIEFVMEEIEEMLQGMGPPTMLRYQGAGVKGSRSQGKGKDTDTGGGKGKSKGEDQKVGKGRDAGKGKKKETNRSKVKGR